MEVIEKKHSDCDVIWHYHPALTANRKHFTCVLDEGLSVRQLLLKTAIDTNQPIVVFLNDRLLKSSEWDDVRPKAGEIINVKATVLGGGGGDGSNPLQVVAMIALVIAVVVLQQYYLLPALGTMGSALAGMAIMAAGSYIIGSIFAASMPSSSLSGLSGQYGGASPTYSLSGGSNRIRPYESMPVVMGYNRFFPDLASKPFTEYHGEDQYLYQIFHLGLSNLVLSDWQIGTTLLDDYQDVYWHSPDQDGKISAFPGNVDTVQGGELLYSDPPVIRTTSINTYRIGVDIEGVLYYATDAGGLETTIVRHTIQYRPLGSTTWINPTYITAQGAGFSSGHYESYIFWVDQWVQEVTVDYDTVLVDRGYEEVRYRFVAGSGNTVIVSGNTQTSRRATLFFDVPKGQYEVKVSRDTPDSSNARLQNKTNWSALRSYQLDDSSYVGQNRRGLVIRASSQLNGAIQQLSVKASARANYWNGTIWVTAETSNPAHWFMDFSIGRRDQNGKLLYGIGLPVNQVDIENLHSWANFCESEGLTFNAVLDGQLSASDLLSAIARCGFGSPTWSSGKIGVVWDSRNATPVAAFGMSNIIKGSFNVSYITEQLAEEIIIRYVNPSKDWVQDEVRVNAPGITSPTRSSTVDLLGCTNEAMAGKFANYLAAQQYYRKRRIQWSCDFEGFVCQRGDVVLLSHDLTQWGYSGRIVSKSGSTITLDRKVPRSGSTDYLMIKKPDGTMTTYTVISSTGESDTLTLSSAPSLQDDYLDMDHIWFFSPLATTGKKVKILSVQPSTDSLVTITATDEYDEFYAAWDGTWTTPPNNTQLLDGTPVIKSIVITESLYKKESGIVSKATVSFTVSGLYDHANYRYKFNNGSWVRGVTFSNSFDIDATEIGDLYVEITPLSQTIVGKTVTKKQYIFGLSLPPSNVENFVIDGTRLSWTSVSDIDLAGYKIKYQYGSNTQWGSANPLHDGLLTSSPYTMSAIPPGVVTILIKAVDQTGNESDVASYLITDLGDSLVANVVESYDYKAIYWSGDFTNATKVSGNLEATQSGYFYNYDLDTFYQADGSSFYRENYDSMEWISSAWKPSVYASGSSLTASWNLSGNSVSVEYRLVGPNPFYEDDLSFFYELDSSEFYDSPTAWSAWPGSVVSQNTEYQWRVTTSSGSTKGILSSFIVSVDVPDITLPLNDIPLAATGTRLSAAIGVFNIINNIQMTLQGSSSAVSLEIIDKNQTLGPLVIAKNSSGTGVVATIDALLQGY